MRLVFCGTPDFAVPTLRAVAAAHQVELVLTQPDRPVGRKQVLTAPPVKLAALALNIPVFQPERIRTNQELRQRLEAIAPDAILVVAYGRIIPAWMLNLPRYGNINLHASLLPRYRGAAPIQWAVARGESVTGNTTMRIDEGLDTGDMLLQQELAIEPQATAEELFPLLAAEGAELMLQTLKGLQAGQIEPRAQDHALATLAPILTRDDGHVQAAYTAGETYNRWRGFQPWPGAWGLFRSKRLTLVRMARAGQVIGLEPGMLLAEANRLFYRCADECVELVDVQPEGRRAMSAAEFLRGNPLTGGERLE